ncbi:conserved hypothetical protein [Deferribacter desulfuricans SSM1]|uniref:Prepilin-type N-terminal cleavage/methylation domain-containing protein n=1 Tax=Deferribacter desulfuricans (strain DSM 14783 / JCM 11476 / NBRC 101012 / SSM1) TaxID=639282 RepID=D3PDV8_DEFDS|nr:type II secretion system protein [Deferribacter desulfuricans]BAI80781.1 conserved hypothetical protein [Deferribacter desulfuricans SSM1]
MKKGFTLIELLVAFTISIFVIITVYSLVSSIVEIKDSSSKKIEELKEKIGIQKIINLDITALTNTKFEKNEGFETNSISFYSMNSLFFNSGVKVKITYLFEDNNLYRIEENEKLGYKEQFVLLQNVEEFKVLSFDGNDYTENFDKAYVLKFIIKTKNHNYEITAGNMLYE